MNSLLALELVERVQMIPLGTTVRIEVNGPEDVDTINRWTQSTGNTLLTVHGDSVEILRGRVTDPIEALAPDKRPGHRLWIYTNFSCNLQCDYCCVEASPKVDPRTITVDEFEKIIDQAKNSNVKEVFITGGEPFMLIDLDERLNLSTKIFPTTVLTNAMVFTGERRRRLENVDRNNLTLQISLDSATPDLHDLHRGQGSFDKALAGIKFAIESGFRVRVAATLGEDAGETESEWNALCDDLKLEQDQRVIRRIAKQGYANAGLVMSRASLIPEVCITKEGVYWHPVAAIDPSMKVQNDWSPLAETISTIKDEYRQHRIKGDVLASAFPCA